MDFGVKEFYVAAMGVQRFDVAIMGIANNNHIRVDRVKIGKASFASSIAFVL